MTQQNPWIHLRKELPGSTVRLFCFPYAGGAAQGFRTWQVGIGDRIEICPIQYPGRWNRMREPLHRRIETLVDAACAEMLPLFQDKPFAFYGHSMGALIAFELARTLRRNNRPLPHYLFLSARKAPQLPLGRENISHLSDKDFVDKVIQIYNGIPKVVLDTPDLMQLMLPIMRADMELYEKYQCQEEPPLDIPIVALGGTRDPAATREELEAWQAQTSKPLTVKIFEGDHFFITPHEKELLGMMRTALSEL